MGRCAHADDNSGHVQAKDIEELQVKLLSFADSSTHWIKENIILCSAAKTKLLVVCTKELRDFRIGNREITVRVGNQGERSSWVLR